MQHPLRLIAALALLAAVPALHAADSAKEDARLREALRGAMQQLQEAQDQNAVVQGQLDTLKAESAKAEKDLADKNAALTQRLVDAAKLAAVADKAKADADAKIADQASQIARLNDAISKWTAGFNQAAELARDKEAARAALAEQVVVMQRSLDDDRARNVKLYQIGYEILRRYEKFSLGDAIAAKEPFVGSTRTELENLVQKYQDQMIAQKLSTLNK